MAFKPADGAVAFKIMGEPVCRADHFASAGDGWRIPDICAAGSSPLRQAIESSRR